MEGRGLLTARQERCWLAELKKTRLRRVAGERGNDMVGVGVERLSTIASSPRTGVGPETRGDKG